MPGSLYCNEVKFTASTAVVVTGGGAITVTRDQHTVTDAGGPGAGADDLDTVTKINVDEGDEVKLRITAGGSPITLRHAIGNIRGPYSTDVTLSDATDYAVLRYNGTVWNVVAHRVLANTSAELTVGVGGDIAVRRPEHTVLGNGGAADNLDAITGGTIGREVILRPGNAVAQPITLRHAIGANGIELPGGDNIVLATARDYVKLRWDGTAWKVTEACTARGPVGLDGGNVAAGVDSNVVGRVPVIIRRVIDTDNNDHPVVMTYGIRVIDAWFVKTNAAAGAQTLTVRNSVGPANISNAIDINDAVNVVSQAAEINTTNHQVAANTSLFFTTSAAGFINTGIAYVLAQLT